MRILLPVHIYLPDSTAGVEQYTAQLAARLKDSEEVAVVTTRKVISRPMSHIESRIVDGIEVFEVNNHLGFDGLDETWTNPVMETAFSEVLRRFAPDVVHFQHLMYWSTGCTRLARETGARVLFTLHDFWLMCARMGQLVDWTGDLCRLPEKHKCAQCISVTPFGQSASAKAWIQRLTRLRSTTGVALDEPMRAARRLFDRRAREEVEQTPEEDVGLFEEQYTARRDAFLGAAEHVDLFLTPSRSLRDRFVEWGLPDRRIRTLPQGRDHSPFDGIARVSRSEVTITFGFLGTIAPHKGVAELIRAFRGVESQRARLRIVGPHASHPEYWRSLQELASQDARVSLEGPVAPSDVPKTLASFDVSCVPSQWDECCPLTIQEAFMAGVPVVVSDLGGLAELVTDGAGGLTAPPKDAAAWTSVLSDLVANPDRVAELASRIPPVPHIQAHVRDLLAIYREH